ncbi:hypothetical protein JRQ81_005274 [Phrynocephalus forsythii]|uniref:Uncharacterized protein n=1 Tax=Phrynocephalus forsythii TaxID=171643 RepID=A0A9Q1B6S5_9SAUR|nr:hypothetical protein JRQ81_005274 [Phrynocephalus forsythii]
MKSLRLAFVVVVLACHIQAKPDPFLDEKLKEYEGSESAAFQKDDPRLPLTKTVGKINCLSPWGYCLFRNYWCTSGFVMKEQFNNCPNVRTLKCCVL